MLIWYKFIGLEEFRFAYLFPSVEQHILHTYNRCGVNREMIRVELNSLIIKKVKNIFFNKRRIMCQQV